MELEDADGGDAGHGSIEGVDDLSDAVNVSLGVGEDDGIAGFVGAEGGVCGEQRAEIFDELGGFHVADGKDLGDDFIFARNL